MAFQKGNQLAAKERVLRQAYLNIFDRHPKGRMAAAEEIAQSMIHIALRGDQESSRIAAAREIMDRIDGKPSQSTDVSIVHTEIKSFSINELSRIIEGQCEVFQIEGGEGAGVAIEGGVGTAGPVMVESQLPSPQIPIDIPIQVSGESRSGVLISYDDIPTL